MPLQPDDPIPPLKRQLAREIRALLGDTNQHVAAHRLGVDQPRMSDLLHDKLDRFSLSQSSSGYFAISIAASSFVSSTKGLSGSASFASRHAHRPASFGTECLDLSASS